MFKDTPDGQTHFDPKAEREEKIKEAFDKEFVSLSDLYAKKGFIGTREMIKQFHIKYLSFQLQDILKCLPEEKEERLWANGGYIEGREHNSCRTQFLENLKNNGLL